MVSGGLYLDLLKKCLTRLLFDDEYVLLKLKYEFKSSSNVEFEYLNLYQGIPIDKEKRRGGKDSPLQAETMIGMDKLNNLEYCVKDVLDNNVPGDFLETGVWRGGACIFMRGMLKLWNDCERNVWVADSFKGFPDRDLIKYPKEVHWNIQGLNSILSVSLEEVKRNFERYEMLDDQVKFLEGWFKDTLPSAPIEKLAILRLDGDMYESTIQVLEALYFKVSKGGYVIVDDYLEENLQCCEEAVNDFLLEHDLKPIFQHCGPAIFWKVE